MVKKMAGQIKRSCPVCALTRLGTHGGGGESVAKAIENQAHQDLEAEVHGERLRTRTSHSSVSKDGK